MAEVVVGLGADEVVATEVEAGVTAEDTAVGQGFLGLGKTLGLFQNDPSFEYPRTLAS